MNMARKAIPVLVLSLFLPVFAAAAPPSGQTNWGPWSFSWVAGAQSAGLTLRNVRFQDELVIYKASLPVVRVQYADNACGPYADLLSEHTLRPVSFCNNAEVCQRSFRSGGRQWLELGILTRLGQYRMYQVWYFSDDGYIQPHFFSRGLQCLIDHDHHPYWRIDFDINGANADQIFVYDNNRPSQGWGPGWLKHDNEFNEERNPGTNRLWFVRDNNNAHGTWILPGTADGTANVFSNKDAAGRRYHGSEDETWPFGAWGHLGYLDGESLAETDVVLWYVAHMPHAADDGANVWHSVGPWLRIHR